MQLIYIPKVGNANLGGIEKTNVTAASPLYSCGIPVYSVSTCRSDKRCGIYHPAIYWVPSYLVDRPCRGCDKEFKVPDAIVECEA
jgi:hypothetical protein